MKYLLRSFAFTGICLLLAACSSTITASPTAALTEMPTLALLPTQTSTVLADSIISDALPTVSFSTPAAGSAPSDLTPARPTLLPTMDPGSARNLLSKSFSIQAQEGVNGHPIRQITGWEYGFIQGCGGYQWLDPKHLYLYPRTGEWINIYRDGGGQEDVVSQTVAINLETGVAWLPPYQSNIDSGCVLPASSPEHGFMVFPTIKPGYQTEQEAVTVLTFDGSEVASYWGKLIDVSPSGTKILLDEDTWVDLVSGKIADFAWYKYKDFAPDQIFPILPPIWSSDETQVFYCCYFYGNARTGRSQTWPSTNIFNGTWVKNNKYLLLQYHTYWGVDPGYIPLYDPVTNTTLSLNELAGIPADRQCPETSVSADGMYVWVMCYDTNYLVDLSSFKARDFPGYSQVDINWSADSQYAWVDNYHLGHDSLRILSVANKTLTPLPAEPTSKLSWHPVDHVLAYLAKQNKTMVILNAEDMTVKDWKLPSFSDFFWSPNGDRIALLAADGSLWQVDYPKLESLEQLTGPMSAVRDVSWSPDGNSIAYISGPDLYVVETVK